MKILVALLLSSSLAQAALSANRFVEIYNRARANTKFSQQERTKAATPHYVFIAGFLNEALPGYFADNIGGLIDLGIPESHIHVLYPCSAKDLNQNVKELNTELTAIADSTDGKLVLVAHSKGALVTLRHALENPELVKEKIQSIFLIQGALGGSYIADFLRNEGKAIDSRLPLAASVTMQLMKDAEQFVDPLIESSITALTTKLARKELTTLYDKNAKALPIVREKLYYITSEDSSARTSKILKATQSYLETYYGKNDGLVTVNHQSIPTFGTKLAHFTDADHADLTAPYPISQDYSMRRRALAKAIALTTIE